MHVKYLLENKELTFTTPQKNDFQNLFILKQKKYLVNCSKLLINI